MTLIVAPTEPAQFKAIADVVSMAPERMGVDALWSSEHWGMVGVQRKEYRDLIASVADGRLAREVAQMQRLGLAVLMVEGRMRFTMDGQVVDSFVRWTRQQHRGLMRSIQAKGVWIETTDNVQDTVESVLDLRRWCDKPRHNSLDRRPKPQGAWGKASERDFALHLLQGVDGVGPVLADSIIDVFGKVPWQWTCSWEELLAVPGMGPKTAEKLWHALGAEVPPKVKKKRAPAKKTTTTRKKAS